MRDQQDEGRQQEEEGEPALQSGSNDGTAMALVDGAPGGQFGLILRGDALLLVPPGAAAV
ncbi:MAG: hypothetical protein EPO32_01170 [Anaerolineae bacterium]|nr:MAG: hypothetical protein EPO32_01170 [Anaerolineae bacterium]